MIFQVFRILHQRPTQFGALVRQYWLFRTRRFFYGWVYSAKRGIHLGPNVRVQRLVCLMAERPSAQVQIGEDSVIYENARIEAYGHGVIRIGESSVVGDARIFARGEIRIGARLITSWNVFVQDFDPHPIDSTQRGLQIEGITRGFRPRVGPMRASRALTNWDFPTDPIVIGDDVWLGANVTVLKGARIGSGCVVATGSVVTAGEYPARSILAGVPARVVKSLETRDS